jgi:hypothetical protein
LTQALRATPHQNPRTLGPDPAFLSIIEEGRIYISDPMALFQHHGTIQPSIGWLGMGAGF